MSDINDDKGGWDVIAIMHNGWVFMTWRDTEAQAWKLARRMVRSGLDHSKTRRVLISPSFIREVQVDQHDPERWKPKPKDDEPLIETPPERRIIVP